MLRADEAVILALRRTFDFQGRSRRSEYWWFTLMFAGLPLLTATIDNNILVPVATELGESESSSWLSNFLLEWRNYPLSTFMQYSLLITSTSICVRRLHDIGHSGWPVLPYMISFEYLIYSDIDILNYWYFKSQVENTDLLHVQTPYQDLMLSIYILAAVIAVGTGLYLLVASIIDSQNHDNRFGPSPKYGGQVEAFD